MKLTRSWILEHLDTGASFKELGDRLSMLGLVVDRLEDRSQALAPFLIAEIVSCSPHPQADRLQICQVHKGDAIISVVCGASNARAGLKTVLALEGMVIPATGAPLKRGVIRGVESQGMLCSAAELGLSQESEGILELPTDAPVGQPFAATLGYDDPLMEIEITPNRGDCLGVRGVARELAAARMGILKPAKMSSFPQNFSSPISVRVEEKEASHECPVYKGRFIRGVRNGPSPAWLVKKLESIGLKPISALVDITNYLCFDLGRPLHAFDADRLTGSLEIRRGRGESFRALDEKTYTVDERMLVIADEKGPVALAGVMGGMESGCSEETQTVFLESAFFDPVAVAYTGRQLGVQSDSRYRFERGVDPLSCEEGLDKATSLILEICGGEASRVVQAGRGTSERHSILFSLQKVETLGGLRVPSEEILERLKALGCEFTLTGPLACQVLVPSWRSDLKEEADLVEEIVRVVGYDQISSCTLPAKDPVSLSPSQQRREVVRHWLAARGFREVMTWSFIRKEWAHLFGGGQASLRVTNPMSPELEVMRPSLLPSLVETVQRAHDRSQENGALFEIAPVYKGVTPQDQHWVVSGIRSGDHVFGQWNQKSRRVDVFDGKADVLQVLEEVGISEEACQLKPGGPEWYHPGRSGTFYQGQKVIARFGELHPRVLEAMGVKEPLVVFEIFLDALPPFKGKKKKEPLSLSVFQPVERDFAFVVDASVLGGNVLQVIKKVNKTLISRVGIFDVFPLGSGKISLGVRVRLEPSEGTLTEEDMAQLSQKIVEDVHKATGGVLRGEAHE